MNRRRTRKIWFLASFGVVLLAFLAAAPLAAHAGSPRPTAAEAVQQSWQHARDLGSYRFTTDLSATVYPSRELANIGRPGRQQQLHMEGSVDVRERTMLLSLWQGAGSVLDPGDAVEVRIEGDRAYGRQAGGRWEEINDFSGSFAPDGDLLVYLVGARNVVELGSERLVLPLSAEPLDEGKDEASLPAVASFTYTHYAFDLDGPAVAEAVREQWQRQLREQGGVPSGVEVQAPAQLRDATGQGQLWIDGHGLPARLTVEIAYPPDPAESGSSGRATIQTDFSGFVVEESRAPAGGLAGRLPLSVAKVAVLHAPRLATRVALLLAVLVVSLLLVLQSRSRRLYVALALTLILSMIVTPLLESQRVVAFSRRQAEQQAASEARREKAEARQEAVEAMHTSTWDPHQPPPASPESQAAMPPYLVSQEVAQEAERDPEGDADGDTLTAIEEQRLGTNPDDPDSDGDGLRDDLEVDGFLFNDETWYSDPLNVDTNSDGRPDLQECWSQLPLDMPSNTLCNLDTDGDGTPDLFDRDDDGDGVEDGVDLSPTSSLPQGGGAFRYDNPLLLKLSNLEPGVPTFVDLQIRPTNPDHLTYAFNVLDWPAGDSEGQVQRVLNTTFADSMTEEEIEKDPRSANGDLRLIPMVEISIPRLQGHTGNLPVRPGWSGTLGDTSPPIEEWVDMEMLAQYGMTARYADEIGTIVLYAPLNLVSDEIGGSAVAFAARLPYQAMASGDWGVEHHVRVIWALQMLVDQCTVVPAGEDAESWCVRAENRDEQIQIVNLYDDSWLLTGLHVREDHGLQVGIAFEDPATDANWEDDGNLWALANGLDQTWIAARDCDSLDAVGSCVGDGQRDLTMAEIVHRFDNDSNGDMPAEDERLWNIPSNAMKVWQREFAYQDLMVAVPMTHTKELLNEHFIQDGQPLTPAPTLMFLREEHYRSANLDASAEVTSWDGSRLTVDLAPELVSLETMAVMNWAPYRYREGGWEPYPIEEYVEVLEPRLADVIPMDAEDPDGQAILEGQVIMARGFYLGMVQGTQDVVQIGDLIVSGEGQSRDDELKLESIKVAGNIVLTIVKIAGERIVEAGYYMFAVFYLFRPGSAQDLYKWLGEMNKEIQKKGGWSGWNKESGKWLSRFNRLSVATLIFWTICVAVLFFVAMAVDSPVVTYILLGLTAVAGVIRFTSSVVKLIGDLDQIVATTVDKMSALNALTSKVRADWSMAAKGAFILTVVIEAAIAIGLFMYSWRSAGVERGSLAWDQMLVDLIARIVVKTLLWALNFIPVIGKAIFLLISALDALAAWICSFLSEAQQQSNAGQWLCGGISGLLAKVISALFYGQNLMVDLEDEDRWQIAAPHFDLYAHDRGMAAGAHLAYQLTLTNSLRLADLPDDWKGAAYFWQYDEDNLRRSTFDYRLAAAEEYGLDTNLSLDDNGDEWNEGPERDGKQTYTIVRNVDTIAGGIPLVSAGINVTTTVYLHEGYAVPAQECIAVSLFPPVPICWVRESKGTIPADLSDVFRWDVFPESLDAFYERVAVDGGYSLAWAQSGDVRFDRQADYDGDGVRNQRDGGPDPNDGDWDSDHDGLSDSFELQIGLKPDAVGGYDPDDDGLNDRDELLLGTDPFRADTDGDGLTDRLERDGWEFAYGFDVSGNPAITWVTSDPLRGDSDGDGLADLQEYNYRYNPRVASDPHVLAFSSVLSEYTSADQYAPSDGVVRSGDQLRYTAMVENRTLLSSAQGLHAAHLPEALSGSIAPHTFLLSPQEQETVSGELTVNGGIPSGRADLVQTAGARITYALADSDYAQLVLHLEDPGGATTFADSSGNVPPHDGQCTGSQCPTAHVEAYIGAAVQFNPLQQQVITVPDVDISAGDFGVSFWYNASSGLYPTELFASEDGSVNISLPRSLYADRSAVCVEVGVSEWSGPICTGSGFANDRWHHLALSFQNGEGADLYIDGQWVLGGYHEGTRLNSAPQSGVRLGQMLPVASSFSWLLDEVVIYDRPLTWQDVNGLYGAPLFAAHLDEPQGALVFQEDGGTIGSCASTTCPQAGRPGIVRQAAHFDGAQNIQFNPGPNLAGKPFTLAAWVAPSLSGNPAIDFEPQGIFGQLTYGLGTSYPTLVRVDSGIKAAFGDGNSGLIEMPLVPGVLSTNAWNHVVLSYGPNQDGRGQFDLYVNGIVMGRHVLATYPSPIGTTMLSIGDVWSEGTANPAYPALPFRGQIDEVLIYSRVLAAAEVDELYRNQAAALHLPLDEPPGSYQFQDALRRATGSCPAGLTTCPTAGMAGRAGQAARFDGVDDTLDAGATPAVGGTGPLSVAAWVRSDAAKEQVIVQQRSPAVYDGEYQLRLTAAGTVQWWIYGNGGEAEFTLLSAGSVNDGRWHHVAAVRDNGGNAAIYIDGLLDASYTKPPAERIAVLVPTNVYVGADMREQAHYFEGALDELHVLRYALSAEQVRALAGVVPRFLLHLEEPAGSNRFADDTELGNDATCAGCPAAGIKGQVNLAAGFDGVDDGLLSGYEVPALSNKTMMAWVYPDSSSAGRHVVVGTDYEVSWSLFRDGATWHVGTATIPVDPSADWDTGVEVRVGQWQQVAAVFSEDKVRFFLNGHAAGDRSLGAHTNMGRVAVGYDPATGSAHWDGRIDEVAIYERALTDAQIEALWQYQAQWVQEMHTTPLLVDNDRPSSALAAASPYRPNRPVNLLIETADPTSAVVRAEWQVDGGAWQAAPPCEVDVGAAWCPTFDPAVLHGPGAYAIHTRATDAVGNVSDTSSDPIYVDDSPPVVTHELTADALVQLQPHGFEANRWLLPLSGTVRDPDVASGVPGSGVRSLRVTLLDAYERPAGSQLAVVKTGSWDVMLTVSDPLEGGAYTVRVEAEDQVGNGTVVDTPIYLDQSAPQVALRGLPPGGAMLVLPLDEAAGATRFADSSGYGHDAGCGAACPGAGLAGKYGQAIELDGTSQSLAVIDTLDIGSRDFTLAAWFQTASQTWQTIAAATTSGAPAQDVLLLQVTNGGKVRFTFIAPGDTAVTNLTSPPGFHDGQWHHAAAVRRAGELLLYVDGEIVANKSDDRALSGPLRFAFGAHGEGEFFTGRLDEVVVAPLGLASAEVHNLAFVPEPPALATLNGVVSEVPMIAGAVMELHLEEGGGSRFGDSSTWGNAATCADTACPTRVTSGTFFGQALHFDGADDRLSILNSSALWSLQDNWTLSAWIQPDRLSGDQQILTYSQASPGGFAFGTHGAGLRFSAFGVGAYDSTGIALQTGIWQQVAMRLAGGDLTFFVDGVAREVITGTQLLQPNLIETDSVYVGESFQGSIDEALLFDRPLSRDEVLALGAKKHAGVSALDLALTPASPGSPLYNAPMPDGAQLYLPLDDTDDVAGSVRFLDISGQGHGGSCVEPSCPSVGHSGHTGTAARFDGVDDRVGVGNWGTFTTATAAAWVYRSGSNAGRETVFSYKEEANCGFVLSLNETNGSQYPRFWVRVGTAWPYAEQPLAIPTGQWVHLAGTYDGETIRLFRNGEEVASRSAPGTMVQCAANAAVGSRSSQNMHFFPGQLDDLLILDRALAPDAVRRLYLGSDTVLHLALDESWASNGTTLGDSSAFASDGALHGATLNHAVAGAVGSGALELDGSGDYVTMGRSIDFARGDYSVSAWFRTSAAAQQVLLSATNPNDDAAGVQLYLDSAGHAHFLHRAPAGSGGGTDLISTGSTSNNGSWHHVVAVKAGSELTLYVDGWPYATGTTSSSFSHALDITLGRQGRTTAASYWNGALDDVRIYARALSAEEIEQHYYNDDWKKLWPTPSGAGVTRSSYEASLNFLSMEGYYRVDLRAADTFGNRHDTTQERALWSGLLDSVRPRAELNYQTTCVGSSCQVHYEFSAHDFGLVEQGLVSPCPADTTLTREYFNAPWYRAWTQQVGANSDRLYALSGECDLPYSGALAQFTVCDASGNCTTTSATPLASAAQLTASPLGGVLILEPSPATILTDTVPLQIQGGAFSTNFLKKLTIRAGNRVIDNLHWARSTVTETTWTATWALAPGKPHQSDGPQQLEVILDDWAGDVYTDSVTVILDRRPPQVTISTDVVTTTHVTGGQVTVAGTVDDANGIAAVDVQVRGVWHPARVSDGQWVATWVPLLHAPPDGQSFTVVVRAVDRAGWTTLASRDVYVDAVSPAPVEAGLSYLVDGKTVPITRTGTTIREPGGTLQLSWTASSDGSGLAGYRAGWTTANASGATTTTWSVVGPDDERLATMVPTEAQKVVASVMTYDLYGNRCQQSLGPLYVDSPLTPDYTPLDPGSPYHGWMESGCSLLGTDRRLSRIASAGARDQGEQSLYATWDSQALRLAWSGANWNAEGDLFVYLDTVPGGSATVFNPYTPADPPAASATPLDAPLVLLPGSMAGATESEEMLADYGVWVENAQTAWLLTWDGSAWMTSTLLASTHYRYEPSGEGGLTDLILPFELLGIADPAATSLGLLAFATEEESLRLWAVLPWANPVTSVLATGAFGHVLEALTAPMTHAYRWPSLAAGVCPNGKLNLAAGQVPYPDAEVLARLTAEPAGTVYHYLGDHLYRWAEYLLGDKPLDFGNLLSFLDRDHPYVADGELITYTLHLENRGQEVAQDVTARVWSSAALTLPEGARLSEDEYLYYQEVAVGDLAPGEARQISFQGQVDLAWAQPRYDECLTLYPERPRFCALALGLALLKVEVLDQSHTTTTGPLERIWADHRVDSQAPRFVGISYPGLHVPAGGVRVAGYAYDESGVPELVLEIQRPDGATVSIPCPNPTPSAGTWTCEWDPSALNGSLALEDGQTFQVRVRATDGAGLSGEPGPWYPFLVDTLPPTVTAHLPAQATGGLPVSMSSVRLEGELSDNHGAAGVQVCLEGDCRSASTTLAGGLDLQEYDDLPAASLSLPACEAGRVQRSFVVTDTFGLRTVVVGLRVAHADRNQIRAELISPAGTRIRLLSGETMLGSDAENLALLLTDAAAVTVSAFARDHDLALPGFVHVARPEEPLSAFVGEQASGSWVLDLCDTDPGGEEGNYLAGRLFLLPQDTAVPSGTWFHNLSLAQLDGVEQTLTVYGLDEAGNRSSQPWSHTFVVDNVAPRLEVTSAAGEVQLTPELVPLEVLDGTVADGGQVRKLSALVRSPEGQLHMQPVTRTGDGWSFALRTMTPGVHTIQILAEDLAGNRTTVGPFTVTVTGILPPEE